MSNARLFLLMSLMLMSLSLYAQQNFRIQKGVVFGEGAQLHKLVLVDYSSLLGYCLDIDSQSVYFKLKSADETTLIPVRDVRYLGLAEGDSTEETRARKQEKNRQPRIGFSDPTYHRTSLPLEGKGQVRIINVAYTIAEFNIGKHLQLGAGTSLFFGFLSTQKLRFSLTDHIHLGLSNQVLLPFIPRDVDELPGIGDVTGNITIGSSDRWLMIGGGIFYSLASDIRPVHINTSFGGKIGEKWHLYGELSLVDDQDVIIILPSFSVAHTIRRHRWRYGFLNIITPFAEPLLPVPLIGYEYQW